MIRKRIDVKKSVENVLATSGITSSIGVFYFSPDTLLISLVIMFFLTWGIVLYSQKRISFWELMISIVMGVIVFTITYFVP